MRINFTTKESSLLKLVTLRIIIPNHDEYPFSINSPQPLYLPQHLMFCSITHYSTRGTIGTLS